jgi:hypothetical protein
MAPRPGDVLVSNSTATLAHDVSIVPAPADIVCPTHDTAIARAHELARDRQVDVWLTEDHTHFMKIASYRPAPCSSPA